MQISADPENHAENRETPLVILTGGGPLPWIVTNAIAERFGPTPIILEASEPASAMMKRRLRMLGAVEAFGQAAFGVALKIIRRRAEPQKLAIITSENLNTERPENCPVYRVSSVNSSACRDHLKTLNPNIVFVVGTRIIRKKTLNCIAAKFINYHAGLNPKYRGMNGGYWAHAMRDSQNFGITVHLIDSGVDTGGTLAHRRLDPYPDGSIVTYPFIQAAAARNVIVETLSRALKGDLTTEVVELESRQWFHPTLWGYVWTGMTRRVW